jgi:hypothetical protein
MKEKQDLKKFNKTTWKSMRVVTPADSTRGVVRVDDDGDLWLWHRANGQYVWVEPFQKFPYRNDMHRLMCTIAAPSNFGRDEE